MHPSRDYCRKHTLVLLLLLLLLLLFQTRPLLRRSIPDPDAQEAAKGQAVDLVAAALEEVRDPAIAAGAAASPPP